MRIFTIAAVVGSLLLLVGGAEAGEYRGIPINLGDAVVTEITPAGDIDTIVFDAHEGTTFSVTLARGRKSELEPELQILAPSGASVGTEARKEKKNKILIKNLTLTETGRYAILVTGKNLTAGAFKLKTRGRFPKKFTLEGKELAPAGEVKIEFPAETDASVFVKLMGNGPEFGVVSVVDPDGLVNPGQAGFLTFRNGTVNGTVFPFGRFGVYGINVGNASSPVVFDALIRVKHPKVKNWKRVIDSTEPEVLALDPVFGRSGDPVTIEGKNFKPGDGLTVLFGDVVARASYESGGRIAATAPDGAGEVDVFVFNPDGQGGMKEKAFIYIPDPPTITSNTPVEGPTAGGTDVTLMGQNFLFVEKVTIGSTDILVSPTSETQLTFTTRTHPAGLVTITVKDRWERTATHFAAFTFHAPPAPVAIDPTAGTNKGGTDCVVTGTAFRPDDRVFMGAVEVTPFTFVDSTRLEFLSPAHPNGYVDVRVEDIWGYSNTLQNAFEFNDGTFTDRTETNVPANSSGSSLSGGSLAIGDVDGDGAAEVVIGGEKGAVLLDNDGSGKFTVNTAETFDRFAVDAAALGDLDGDNDLDLVVTRTGYYQAYYVTNPYGSWYYYVPYPSTRIFINDGGAFQLSSDAIFNIFTQPRNTDLMQGNALALGDVDGDDLLDIVVTRDQNVATSDFTTNTWGYKYFYVYYKENTPATRVLLNESVPGKASFKNVTSTAIPAVAGGDMFAGDDVAIGDVDGDSYPDIIVTGDGVYLRDSKRSEYVAGSKTRILINQGNDTFANETSSMFPAVKTGDDWGGKAVALGDLDGDDIDDVVITTGRPVFYTKGDGTKVYMTSTRVFMGGEYGLTDETSTYVPAARTDGRGEMWRGVDVAVADPDGDGSSDIFLLDRSELFILDASTGGFTKRSSSLRWLFNEGAPLTDLTVKGIPDPAVSGDYYLGDALVLGDVDDDDDLDMLIGTSLPAYAGDGERPLRVFEFR